MSEENKEKVINEQDKKVLPTKELSPKEAIKPEETKLSPSVPADKATDVVAAESEETPEQINWKKFRSKREIERKQKADAEKRAQQKADEAEALRSALEALVEDSPKKSTSYNDSPDEDDTQKSIQAAVKKAIEEEKRRAAEEEAKNFPKKLVKDHPDFQSVCTPENLDYLEFHYPEVTAPYAELPDSYKKWDNIYKAIKKFIPNAPTDRDKRIMDKNQHKPQSSSAAQLAADGRPGKSNFLTEEQKNANWERMQKIQKGVY